MWRPGVGQQEGAEGHGPDGAGQGWPGPGSIVVPSSVKHFVLWWPAGGLVGGRVVRGHWWAFV